MKYIFRIEGLGEYSTNDPEELIDSLRSHLDEEKVITIIIKDE